MLVYALRRIAGGGRYVWMVISTVERAQTPNKEFLFEAKKQSFILQGYFPQTLDD